MNVLARSRRRSQSLNAAQSAPSVVITGLGKGQLLAQGSGFVLELSSTSSASSVSLTNTDGVQVTLLGISAGSAVGALNLGNANLSGTANFQSSVGSLALGQVSLAAINIAGGADCSLTGAELSDVLLLAPAANVSVNVKQWVSSGAGASLLKVTGLTSPGRHLR
jgi:hypothetical protein